MNQELRIKNSKGFTLVELLIVVAIIGVLATLLMANFIGVRQRARDAQRKSDIRQIQSAIEMYRSDNGNYPHFVGVSDYGWAPASGLDLNINGNIYMSTIPVGPNAETIPCIGYLYNGDAIRYTIFTILENSADKEAVNVKSIPNPQIGSSTNGYVTYTITAGSCVGRTYNYWVNNPT